MASVLVLCEKSYKNPPAEISFSEQAKKFPGKGILFPGAPDQSD
jgi:hypothetical protein